MKRNILCITDIIRTLERSDAILSDTSKKFKLEGYDQKTLDYHIQLLKDADYIKTKCFNSNEELPTRLTWKGHEYIDQTLNSTLKVIDQGIDIIGEIE